MTDDGRQIAPVVPDPESQPFWYAAREGKFLLRRCQSCGQPHWFPRTICPFCWSAETEWIVASGRGTIYSWTVMRRAKHPYAIAYVELEEGPRMLSNIVDCDLDSLAIGQEVIVSFVQTAQAEGPPVPMFCPATNAGGNKHHR